MNPQIKQKLEELTDLISKLKIEGSQYNEGATIEGWQYNEGTTIKESQDNRSATIKESQDNRSATIKGSQDNRSATIKGWQNNQGATIEGKMIFDSKTNFKKGIWKVEKTGLVEYELTPKK